ncbi:MAG: type IV secretion protein Rhs, partial [Acidobacteria bacterium]
MSVHSSFARAIASILVVGQLFVGMPLTAAPAAPVAATPASQSSATSPTITPNRTIPEVTSPATTFTLSATPTDAELSSAHAFPEPLVPMSRPTTDAENGALAAALTEYAGVGQSELVAPLTRFLSIFPRSAWRASLLANIGAVYRTNGFYASALNAWRLAWADARDEVNPRAKAVADMALGEWLDLSIQVGHSDEVSGRLAELLGRPLSGRAAQKVASAREQLWLVRNRPEQVHPSGSAALGAVLAYAARVAGNPFVPSDVLRTYRMTATDTTLNELRTLAQRVGLSWNMVLRPRDADIPVPSVMHWRLGHFTAVLKHEGDRYLLVDSILGGARWVSRDMLDQESSGYFLAPPSTLTAAWPQVTQADAATVIGRCPPNTPDDSDPCGPCGSGSSGGPGMATYSLQMMPANLRVTDLPLTYVPTIGPAVSFRLTYNQRESLQPQIFSSGNIGSMWTFDWVSAVIDDPTHPTWSADVVLRGGGAEHYFNMSATGTFPAHWRSRAVLVQVSSNPIRYERRLRDGGVEVFAQSDGTVTAGRRVYLTDIMDPQGQTAHLTYDSSLRVVAITDATGLVTTLSYELATDPLKITRVTDPYGRFATLTYNDAGLLKRITDGIGLTSDFTYGPANFLVSLTTPYGTTLFKHETDPSQDFYYRFIQATDPLGGTERAEFHWSTTALPSTAPTAEVPTGFSAYNHDLDLFNTFYWDKRAMAMAPGDVSAAVVTHWLASDWADISLITGNYFVQVYSSAVPHSMKRPLEHRVWYAYPGQTTPFDAVGTWMEPTQTARVLDDGTAQIAQATYNDQGNVTSRIDPLGRQTTYDYANNGMDLLQIRQTSNGVNDLLASSSDYTSQHRAQTTTDASGQSTTYTYNSVGQPLTVTNAKNETTTFAYDADHRLRTVTAPMNGAVTTYTYDDYGRMRTVTDADGYTATTDYDAFDRPTRVTYPGGTTQTTTYDRLDVAARTDRIGRTTRYFYDPLRRLVSTRDLLGRIVAQEWCTCGSLSKLIDANGRATSWDRDVQGRVTRELRADGTTATTYTYDATTSRLKTVTDPKGQVTTYTYTLDDAIQQVAYSNSQIATPSVSYTYDPTYARAATMADGTGTTAYAYHPVGELGAGHVASVDGPFSNDTITYAYDELGRVASRAINGVAMTQGYDPLGRVTTEA